MRGEHSRSTVRSTIRLGSSPHARGTPRLKEMCVPIEGIIPACAGNTRHSPSSLSRVRDHPRMRGEHMT